MKKSEAIKKLTDFIIFNTKSDSYDVVAKRILDFLENEIGMYPPYTQGVSDLQWEKEDEVLLCGTDEIAKLRKETDIIKRQLNEAIKGLGLIQEGFHTNIQECMSIAFNSLKNIDELTWELEQNDKTS